VKPKPAISTSLKARIIQLFFKFDFYPEFISRKGAKALSQTFAPCLFFAPLREINC